MGTFTFYQKTGAKGKIIGTLDDNYPRDLDLTKTKSWQNDEISSVEFSGIAKGTVLELWDASKNRRSDDWVRFTFDSDDSSGVISNVEKSSAPGVSRKRSGRGNLRGKVSHISVVPGGPRAEAASAYVRIQEMPDWSKKDGRAYEFETGDSNFRVWLPRVEPTTGGVTLTFKLDHIRSLAKDDNAAVTMVFDKEGILVSESVEIKYAGQSLIVRALEARNDALAALTDQASDPRAKAVMVFGVLIGAMQAALVKSVEQIANSGGRALFPGVITQQMGAIGAYIRDALQPPDGHGH